MQPIQHTPDIPSADNNALGAGFVRMYNGSAAALAAGDVVAEDLSVTTFGIGTAIKKSTAAAGGGGVIGAAHTAIPIGEWGDVQVEGIDDDVAVTSGSALDLLGADGSNAGRLVTISGTYAATHLVVARLLTAPSGNVATVRWFNPSALRTRQG